MRRHDISTRPSCYSIAVVGRLALTRSASRGLPGRPLDLRFLARGAALADLESHERPRLCFGTLTEPTGRLELPTGGFTKPSRRPPRLIVTHPLNYWPARAHSQIR